MKTTTITRWNIDKAHSEVQFKVKHLVISTVTGQFNEFDAGLETYGENLDNARAWFSAEVNSISTRNTDRDDHLKSADFFDSENYPQIKFESTGFRRKDNTTYTMTGNLTIRGITKEITLTVDYGGTMVDPYGNTKAGFEISGILNRQEYGLKWSAVTEAGGLVVADEIKLAMNIQMTKK